MSSKDRGPMPEPYTTVNTGYPVGTWMPGKFYTLEYLAWMHAGDPVPYSERHFDADESTGTEDDDWQEPTVAQLDPYFKPQFNAWVGDPAKKRGVA